MDQGVLCERLLELVLGQESAHPVLDSDNVAGFLALLVFLTVSLLVDHFVHHFGLDQNGLRLEIHVDEFLQPVLLDPLPIRGVEVFWDDQGG